MKRILAPMLSKPLLALAVIVSFVAPAYAEVIGTYKGGFESRGTSISIELRCDGNRLCEDELIETNGGQKASLPVQKRELKPLGGCAVPPKGEWDECEIVDWEAVRKAIDFARKNIDEQKHPELKSQLMPFLKSSVELGQCYSMPGSSALCELLTSPWGKPALLYLPMMLQPCHPPSGFCTYRLIPLFKTSDEAKLRSAVGNPALKSSQVPQEVQSKVAPYIRQLEDLVHAKLVVPPGTPSTARLTVHVQFDGNTGRIHYVSPLPASTNTGCSCPEFRMAVKKAVNEVKTFPLLPIVERSSVGGGQGRIEFKIVAKNATAPVSVPRPVAKGQVYPPFPKGCKIEESVDLGTNKAGEKANSTLVRCDDATYVVLGTVSSPSVPQTKSTWTARKILPIPLFRENQVVHGARDCIVTDKNFDQDYFIVVTSGGQGPSSKSKLSMPFLVQRPDIETLDFETIPISFVRCR